ncbi:MAG: carbohydrate binding domain-containing protein [archaeon]
MEYKYAILGLLILISVGCTVTEKDPIQIIEIGPDSGTEPLMDVIGSDSIPNKIIDDSTILDDFEADVLNFGATSGPNSEINIEKSNEAKQGTNSLKITYHPTSIDTSTAYGNIGNSLLAQFGQADFSRYENLVFWLKSDDVGSIFQVYLGEHDNDWWVHTVDIMGTDWQLIRIPLDAFIQVDSLSTGDGMLDLTGIDILNLAFNSGPDSTLEPQIYYIDDIKGEYIIDNFESKDLMFFGNANVESQISAAGDTSTVHEGQYSLKIQYTPSSKDMGVAGANVANSLLKQVGRADFQNFNALSFWINSDGKPGVFQVSLGEQDGDWWYTNVDLTQTGWREERIAFDSMVRADHVSTGDSVMDLTKITTISFGLNSGEESTLQQQTIYIDYIRLI